MPTTISSQNFDSVTAPALPPFSLASSSNVITSTSNPRSSPNSLTSTANPAAAETWAPGSGPDGNGGNALVSCGFYFADAGRIGYLLLRSSTTDISTAVAYGAQIQSSGVILNTFSGGIPTPLNASVGTLTAGIYYVMTLTANGTAITVSVQRDSDNNYLTSGGAWQAGIANCISVTNATVTGQGYAFLAMYSGTSAKLYADDFLFQSLATPTPPATVGGSQSLSLSL